MPGIPSPLVRTEIELDLRFRHHRSRGNGAKRGWCGRSPAAVRAQHPGQGPEATMPRDRPCRHRSASHQRLQPIDDRWHWAPADRLDGNGRCPAPANHGPLPSVVLRFAHVGRAQIASSVMAAPGDRQHRCPPVPGSPKAQASTRCNKATPDESTTPTTTRRSAERNLPRVQQLQEKP